MKEIVTCRRVACRGWCHVEQIHLRQVNQKRTCTKLSAPLSPLGLDFDIIVNHQSFESKSALGSAGFFFPVFGKCWEKLQDESVNS